MDPDRVPLSLFCYGPPHDPRSHPKDFPTLCADDRRVNGGERGVVRTGGVRGSYRGRSCRPTVSATSSVVSCTGTRSPVTCYPWRSWDEVPTTVSLTTSCSSVTSRSTPWGATLDHWDDPSGLRRGRTDGSSLVVVVVASCPDQVPAEVCFGGSSGPRSYVRHRSPQFPVDGPSVVQPVEE